MASLTDELVPLSVQEAFATANEREEYIKDLEERWKPLKLIELLALSNMLQNTLIREWLHNAAGWNHEN
jgi:hypothetical protein